MVRALALEAVFIMQGFFQLHRKIIDSAVFQDGDLLKLWIYCLSKSSYKDRQIIHDGDVIELRAGEFVTGRKVLARDLGITERQVRTRLAVLHKMGNIVVKTTNRFSIITIVNWAYYQNTQDKTTSRRPADDQQTTTNNNVNKVNNNIGDESPVEDMWNKRHSDDFEEGTIDLDGDGTIKDEQEEAKLADRKAREDIKYNLRLVEEPRGLAYNPASLNADVKVYQQLLKYGWSHEVIIKEYLAVIDDDYWKNEKKLGKYPSLKTVEFRLRNKQPS